MEIKREKYFRIFQGKSKVKKKLKLFSDCKFLEDNSIFDFMF